MLIGQCEVWGMRDEQPGLDSRYLDHPIGHPPRDTASLALNARAGSVSSGVRERLGQHHGRWRDVILVERRSSSVGVAGSAG